MRIGLSRAGHNFFGDGSDGALTVSTNTDLTSVIDGDFVIKQYTSLTVNVGQVLSVSNRCKGLIIYVQGNCVLNGFISMTGKGANAVAPSDGLICSFYNDSSGTRGLPVDYLVTAAGGTGAAALTVSGTGITGGTILNGTGGGGSGGHNVNSGRSGAGADGTCFSGGSGGSGANTNNVIGGNGAPDGGAGGDGPAGSNTGGGAGNPGGNPGGSGAAGSSGTGGFVMLVVGGNYTVGASGGVQADGLAGGGGTGSGGGGSGGGRVMVFYAGTLSNSGVHRANGGAGGIGSTRTGGAGGAGTVTGPTKISA